MDWDKVIESLRTQAAYHAKQAAHWETMSGYHERVKQYRANADLATILAAALNAGMEK